MSRKSEIEPVPKQYWEDSKWANENFSEIVKKYPDMYVGVYKKEIVAYGKTGTEVKNKAFQSLGIREFPIIFAEKTIYVYQS